MAMGKLISRPLMLYNGTEILGLPEYRLASTSPYWEKASDSGEFGMVVNLFNSC
jgi:hypothetical protein